MKKSTYTLEFITPCFCAGADPGRAEIRGSAIRGQLRWWFRVLGGTPSEEQQVFGSVAGSGNASSLMVRIEDIEMGKPWSPPSQLDINSNAYVYYFASVSGAITKGSTGPRWKSQGAIAPGTKAKLTILQKRPLEPALQGRFDQALNCFLKLGAIGLRATRGLGAFTCHERRFEVSVLQDLTAAGFHFEELPKELTSVDAIAKEIGSFLKGTRKATGMKFDSASPFGSSSPRQTSAIYFRPVSKAGRPNCWTILVFEAPQERVLDSASRRAQTVVGQDPSRLTRPDPNSGKRFNR
jgi:CRISPR type III-B/RAMP module RAMP protein Cmr1